MPNFIVEEKDRPACVDLDRVGESIAAAARRNLKLKGDIQSPEIEVRFTPESRRFRGLG